MKELINHDIIIDFKVPLLLQNTMLDAEEAAKTDRDLYETYQDAIDMCCKMYYTEGILTKKQWDLIMRRYPWPED